MDSSFSLTEFSKLMIFLSNVADVLLYLSSYDFFSPIIELYSLSLAEVECEPDSLSSVIFLW